MRAALGAILLAALPAWGQTGDVLLHWSLDRGPRALDASPSALDGTVTGAEWDAEGKVGGCLRFSRPEAAVGATATALSVPRGRAELWIEPAARPDRDALIFVLESTPGWRYRGLLRPDGTLAFALVSYTGEAKVVGGKTPLPLGQWSHVAVEWDAGDSQARLLVNDRLDGEGPLNVLAGIGSVWLGAAPGVEAGTGLRAFSGRLDEFRLTVPAARPTAFPPPEPGRRPTAGLDTQALYHFDQAGGMQVWDDGPNALHGKLWAEGRWRRDGKFGGCLETNGVSTIMEVGDSFTEPNLRLSFWLCPATDPTDTVAAVFARAFSGPELRFRGDAMWGYLATGGPEPTWALYYSEGPGLKREVRGREGSDQYVLATDSDRSGFIQQMWLSRADGTLRWHYYDQGSYRQLASQTVVWKKGQWTHAALDLNVSARRAALWINGRQEAQCPLSDSQKDWRLFTFGGSWRDGVPFSGLLDELEVVSYLPAAERLTPWGGMEGAFSDHGEGVALPDPLRPYGLAVGEDRASRTTDRPHTGEACLELRLGPGAAPGREARGVALRAPRLTLGHEYDIQVAVRGTAGRARLAAGPSALAGLAEVTAEGAVSDRWRVLRLVYEPWAGETHVFVTFDRPGSYCLDSYAITPR